MTIYSIIRSTADIPPWLWALGIVVFGAVFVVGVIKRERGE